MHVCILQMLYFERIHVSEGINHKKTSASNRIDNCQYWYFLNKGFKFKQMSAMDVLIY